jgi:hypothetical protein
MVMVAERRRSFRRRLDRISYIDLGPGNGGVIVDLSDEGLSFQAVAPVQNRRIVFSFIYGRAFRLKAGGELQWSDQTSKRGGLRFVELTNDARQYVRSLLSPYGEPFRPEPDRGERNIPSSGTDTAVIHPMPKAALDSCTSAMSLAPVRGSDEPILSLHPQQRPGRTRQQYFRGFATGFCLSLILLISISVFRHYQGGIGKLLLLAGQKLSSSTNPTQSESPVLATFEVPDIRSAPLAIADEPTDLTRAENTTVTKSQVLSEAGNSPPTAEVGGTSVISHTKRPQAHESGEEEFRIAEQDLNRPNLLANSRAAAPWLWLAVKKGNVGAEIALSQLYLAGDGVDQNCEQARILLKAAAKKGSTVAMQKLRATDEYSYCGANPVPSK